MTQLFESQIAQKVAQFDTTPPTFGGITGLAAQPNGSLRVTFDPGVDLTPPLRYAIYIKTGGATGLFSPGNRVLSAVTSPIDLFFMPGGALLQKGVEYTVGVRSLDGRCNEDQNLVSLSATSAGVLTQDALTLATAILTSVTNVDQTTTDLEGVVTALQALSTELSDDIAAIDASALAAVASQLVSVKDALTVLVSHMGDDLDRFDGDLVTLEGTSDTLASSVADFAPSLAQLSAALESLDALLITLQERIDSMQSTVDDMQSLDIASAQVTGVVDAESLSTSGRVTIVRGEDKTLVLRLIKENGEPFSTAGATKISFEFKKQNNESLELSTVASGGYAASAVYGGITLTAAAVGVAGNSIALTFNGTDTIGTVVGNWNTAHPTNMVSHSGAATVVPAAGTVTLAGGVNQYAPVTVVSVPEIGKLSVKMTEQHTSAMRLGKMQTFRASVDFGAAPQGDRKTVLFRDVLDVVDREF